MNELHQISQILIERETIDKDQFERLLAGEAEDSVFPEEPPPPSRPSRSRAASAAAPASLPDAGCDDAASAGSRAELALPPGFRAGGEPPCQADVTRVSCVISGKPPDCCCIVGGHCFTAMRSLDQEVRSRVHQAANRIRPAARATRGRFR